MAKAKAKKAPSRAAQKAATMSNSNHNPLVGMFLYDGVLTCEIVEAVDATYVIVQNFTLDDDNEPQLTDQRMRAIAGFAEPGVSLFDSLDTMLEYIDERSAPEAPTEGEPQPS